MICTAERYGDESTTMFDDGFIVRAEVGDAQILRQAVLGGHVFFEPARGPARRGCGG